MNVTPHASARYDIGVKYCVVMYRKDHGRKLYLSHNNRTAWCKRTALKHLNDVQNDLNYTDIYSHFELEED